MDRKIFSALLSGIILVSICEIASAGMHFYYDKSRDLYGFKNAKNQIVIPAQFDYVLDLVCPPNNNDEVFSPKNKEFEFLVPVVKRGKLYRITKDGALKFESVRYDNAHDYYKQGLARFIKNNKVGFHDRMGNIIIEPIYDGAFPFDDDGYANVCVGCYMQYPENPTFPVLNSRVYGQWPREDMYGEVKGGKWGKVDKKGNVIWQE